MGSLAALKHARQAVPVDAGCLESRVGDDLQACTVKKLVNND